MLHEKFYLKFRINIWYNYNIFHEYEIILAGGVPGERFTAKKNPRSISVHLYKEKQSKNLRKTKCRNKNYALENKCKRLCRFCREFVGEVAAKSVAWCSYINLILIAGWSFFFFGTTFDVAGLMLRDLNKDGVDLFLGKEE